MHRSLSVLCLLAALILTTPSPRAQTPRLVGTWQLVTRTVSVNGKTLADPVLGAHPLGRLSYDASGAMSLQMMRTLRTMAIGTPADAKDKANQRVILGYDSYFGTYTVDERAGTITHHVEASLFPEDVGQHWVRPFTLEGDTLTLSFTSPADGVNRTLVFQRLPQALSKPPEFNLQHDESEAVPTAGLDRSLEPSPK
jgi:hypothetical protein